jgi:AraC-like DNA-binding protein
MRIAPTRAQWIAHTFYLDLLHTADVAAADECLRRFFEDIVVGDDRQRPMRDDALVRRVLDYVHDTPETSLTLQDIAGALQVRAPYLTHAFARHTGQPLYRYVMSLKLSRALFRIAAGDEDLTRIALDLGFSSHSHLSAAFKARYGRSPSTARKARSSPQDSQESGIAAPLKWRPLCAARGGTH